MTHSDLGTGSDKVLERQLGVQQFGETILLDCVVIPAGNSHAARLFFKSGTHCNDILASDENTTLRHRPDCVQSLDLGLNSPMDPVVIAVNGQECRVQAQAAETDLFSGLDVIIATRNGESAETAFDWLTYHVSQHGMQAAVILDQAPPDESRQFIAALQGFAKDIEGLVRVVVVHSACPLGKKGLPAEAHPLNVLGAPKRRQTAPPDDPWRAPLGEFVIYEIIRARFLASARAVANLDLCDLLACDKGPTIFDRAVHVPSRYTCLHGVQSYPWRVRRGRNASFSDHICTRFDSDIRHLRWCVAAQDCRADSIWHQSQILGATPDTDRIAKFSRSMLLRHPTEKLSQIVPKAGLVEAPELLDVSLQHFGADPVRMPKAKLLPTGGSGTRTVVVTTMKNEGPFVLEWLAYHRAIGVDEVLVYTNDCSDGTDSLLRVLQDKGYVQHRDNPYRGTDLKPQHAAFQAAEEEPVVRAADWLVCMDVDEFINIRCGNGRLSDLYAAIGDANMIAMTWRLFGNSDVSRFSGALVTREFTRCAHEVTRRPHQAWGFKTLFRNNGVFKRLGVHRPKGLQSQHWQDIRWVNGSGRPMPRDIFRNGWRSTIATYGYDLVQLNHYAVRSAESFLVKRDRGRVNHVERDQGLSYWFRMNNNAEDDRSIQRMMPALEEELARLLTDPDIAAAHEGCCRRHRERISELKAREDMLALFREITGEKLRKLSRMHAHFCTNVFLGGPEVIPDEVADRPLGSDFFFTVQRGETNH
ncbi:glycosyltransferase family 2 protein [Phaeobacter sp. A36a-5a]|uniref:glycosyltransferase family 2 protein n=1 Tax=Phaeobacter bryozoorum TaxID=1086632 RepID=UPI0030C8F3F4